MIYLLLILFPLAAAAGAFILRRDSTLAGWAGVGAVTAELWLALTAPVNQPARLLDVSVNYNELSQLFLTTFCIGGLAMTLLAAVRPEGEYFVAALLLILGLSAAILILQEPFVVASLLFLASLLGGLQLVDQPADSPVLMQPHTIGMALKYTLLVALGGVLLLIGFVLATAFTGQLASTGPVLTHTIFALLLIGFCIRVGLLPFHLWLPDVLDEAPPPTIFVQLGLLTALSFPVLLVALQTQPQLLVGNSSGQRLMLGLGFLSALGGGALALAAAHTRRAIGYLAVANMGLLATGLAMTNAAGVGAALLGALSHVLGLTLIALGLALLEQPVPGRREQAGAMRERPMAALALLLGVLLLLGVPPFSGFLPKLLLFSAVAGESGVVGLLVGGALVLNGVAGARLLSQALLRPSEAPTTRSLFSDDLDRLAVVAVPYAPRAVLVVIVLLAILSIVVGVWPQPVITLIDEAMRGLPFLSR